MRILVLDEFLCFPVDSGKKTRTYNILKQMASRHAITLIAFVWGEPSEASGIHHLESLGIRVVTVRRRDPKKSGLAFCARLAANLFSPLPYIVAGHFLPTYRDRVAAVVRESSPDILLAEWSPYAAYLKAFENVPRVAVAHNLESNIWRGYFEQCESWIKRQFIALQYRRVEAFEHEIFDWLDGVIAVSPVEMEQLTARHPQLHAALVENGVDASFFAPSLAREENLVSFTGSMDWRPNQDGVEHFINAALPLLRQQVPDVRVLIIGRQPPKWLVSLGSLHGVEFTGSVADVRPFMSRTSVSIVPLRIGGGSRLKILEALGMEKAVVSTTLGAEGLRVRSGEHLIIADDPQEFADAVASLLGNQAERQRLAKAGRRLVLECYRWETIAAIQSAFLERMIQV